MKSPHIYEFQSIVQLLSEDLEGAQLQEVQCTADGVVLGFYRFSQSPKSVWLVVDLDIQFPFLGLFQNNPWAGLKSVKPVGLFLNSHFKNRNIYSIQILEDMGRVMRIYYSSQLDFYIEIRLIPKQPNLIAKAHQKQISWDVVRDLEVQDQVPSQTQLDESRSVAFMNQQWSARRSKNKVSASPQNAAQSPYEKWMKQKKKDLEKKQKAMALLDQQIQTPLVQVYRKIGEHLKVEGFKNLPIEYTQHVDFEHKVSWNIEKLFEKSKALVAKSAGAQKRKLVLQQEIDLISDLSETKFAQELERLNQKKTQTLQRKPSDGQLRKNVLDADKNIVCWMGKNAQENMKLLRSSKPWDLWIHLKDYPSAYAIVQRNKEQKISDQYLIQSAAWLAQESFKSKKNVDGLKLAVVVVECRHVKPIKGDKLGRVTYHHPRELLITV